MRTAGFTRETSGSSTPDGYLKITDRKKDLLKTAGGKYIAPQPIENTVRLNKFVASAVVLGDQRKFPINPESSPTSISSSGGPRSGT